MSDRGPAARFGFKVLATARSLNETDKNDSHNIIKAVSEGANSPQVVRDLPSGYTKVIAAVVSRQPQRSFFDPEMLALLGEAIGAWPVPEVAPLDYSQVHQDLTPREREVLTGIFNGLSSKQVARELGISPRTVDYHRANLLKKSGAKNTAELVRKVFST